MGPGFIVANWQFTPFSVEERQTAIWHPMFAIILERDVFPCNELPLEYQPAGYLSFLCVSETLCEILHPVFSVLFDGSASSCGSWSRQVLIRTAVIEIWPSCSRDWPWMIKKIHQDQNMIYLIISWPIKGIKWYLLFLVSDSAVRLEVVQPHIS